MKTREEFMTAFNEVNRQINGMDGDDGLINKHYAAYAELATMGDSSKIKFFSDGNIVRWRITISNIDKTHPDSFTNDSDIPNISIPFPI